MSKLSKLQTDFFDAFYQNSPECFVEHIANTTSALSAQERFQIYKNSIQGGLINSLSDTYAVIERLVGEDFFYAMAMQYIAKTPSTSTDLGQYGASFADFVAHFPAAHSLAYLPDMCRLAWTYHLLNQQKNENGFDINEFSLLSDDQQANVRFALSETVALFYSDYPVKQIWDLCHGKGDDEKINLQAGPVYLILSKLDRQVTLNSLTSTEWQLATLLQKPIKLSVLSTKCNQHAIDLSTYLPVFLKMNWLRYIKQAIS